MVYHNKNLKLKLNNVSSYAKPIVTPTCVVKDFYTAEHYNACTAAYKNNGDFVSVTTGDSRMKQVLQQTQKMMPGEVRVVSRITYTETYRVSKAVWEEILKAHEKEEAPATPETASGL